MKKSELVPGKIYKWGEDKNDYFYIGENFNGDHVFQNTKGHDKPFIWAGDSFLGWKEKKFEVGQYYTRRHDIVKYLLVGYDSKGFAVVENMSTGIIFVEPNISRYVEVKP